MSSFDETVEKLKAEIEGHIATIKATDAWGQAEKIYRALGTIEELAGKPKTSLADLFGFATAVVTVKKGEFIGKDAVAAAKEYLKKKGEAADLDEIVEAINVGGASNVSRESLRISLARSTWDIQKAPDQELYKYAPRKGKKKAGALAGDEEKSEPEATNSTTAGQ